MAMLDSQVDLCGQLDCPDTEVFPILEPGQAFSFACAGCGDCCRGREDIVLSGYDLWRICAHLRLPPRIVVQAFCRQYTGRESHMPVVRLQPLKGEKANCPFLHESRCAIHAAKPLVCALYPLGQQIGLDGAVTYFTQPLDCGGQVMTATREDYLDRCGIRDREPLDVQWALTCIRLSARCKALEPVLGPARMRMVQRRIYRALYLEYDYAQPYKTQFAQNLAKLEQVLCRLTPQQDSSQEKI